ncbi:MAG: hypothetical protein ACE5EI_06155 [Thermodesulfobacteriota bacterium]
MNDREHISRWNLLKRNVFINKRFQADFAWKFLVLIVAESLLAIGLFVYLSRGTVITGWSGSEVVVAKTGEYFLPTLLLTNLAVIGLTAAVGFVVLIVVSHKIAGPLWRFEKTLEETSAGDLTRRFSLRTDDQMHELAEKMNRFNSKMDSVVADIQSGLAEMDGRLEEAARAIGPAGKEGAGGSEGARRAAGLLVEAQETLSEIRKKAGYFKTSRTGAGGG